MATNSDMINQSLAALRQVIGEGPVALHAPTFVGSEWESVKDCLDSTFVSSVGEYVDRFESGLASYTGAKHVVAVVNGTAALHISYQLAGVVDDDEVLVPALTFVATAAAIRYCNAVPHFVESDEQSLGIDPVALRAYLHEHTEQRDGLCVNKSTGRTIRALVLMHTFGHPNWIDELLSVADDFGLVVVEDAAESLGSRYRDRHTGTFGRLGTLSFNGNKIITTGGGGAILTNDTNVATRAKHLTTTAKLPHMWRSDHDEVGYNYRLPNLNAALGCAQLDQLPQFLDSKRELLERYKEVFQDVEGIELFEEREDCRSNYWLQTLLLDKSVTDQRDELLQAFNDAGYMSRPVWTLIHQLKPYQDCPRMDLTVAENLAARLISIPSSANIGAGRTS